ncbi:MAG: efflux RND transporter periplasmic adaptor subunit [Methylovirgula sp.]|jgi:RND family efflux transporter MFP subunit
MRAIILAVSALLSTAQTAIARESLTVVETMVADEKAVFGQVESVHIAQARARIGGTLASIKIREGDHVEAGQLLGTVADEKLTLQLNSLTAQISGLDAQLAQAKTDLDRAQDLFTHGTIPRARLDQVQTDFNVAQNAERSRVAEKSVIEQQLTEGDVLAPTDGRVLTIPVTPGSVMLPGETLATIAVQNFVLRLRVPERHVGFIKEGDIVRYEASELGEAKPQFGHISLVYPEIDNGRIIANATVEGLGDYFVGERIRVWVSAGTRNAIIIPDDYIATKFGIDYVHLRTTGDAYVEIPVQRGRPAPRPELQNGIEILSGIKPGDVLVKP